MTNIAGACGRTMNSALMQTAGKIIHWNKFTCGLRTVLLERLFMVRCTSYSNKAPCLVVLQQSFYTRLVLLQRSKETSAKNVKSSKLNPKTKTLDAKQKQSSAFVNSVFIILENTQPRLETFAMFRTCVRFKQSACTLVKKKTNHADKFKTLWSLPSGQHAVHILWHQLQHSLECTDRLSSRISCIGSVSVYKDSKTPKTKFVHQQFPPNVNPCSFQRIWNRERQKAGGVKNRCCNRTFCVSFGRSVGAKEPIQGKTEFTCTCSCQCIAGQTFKCTYHRHTFYITDTKI